MNSTVQTIVSEVISEVGGDSDDTTFNTLIFGFFKSGLRHIPAYIRDRIILAEVNNLSLSASSYSISLSSISPMFIRERSVWYLGDNNERIPIVRPPSPNYFHDNFAPAGSGAPAFYNIKSYTMYVDKTSDQAYTVGMDYFKEISDVELTDTFYASEPIVECAKHWCKSLYYRNYEEDKTKADDDERLAKEIMATLDENYMEQELGSHIQESDENW